MCDSGRYPVSFDSPVSVKLQFRTRRGNRGSPRLLAELMATVESGWSFRITSGRESMTVLISDVEQSAVEAA
jgi:hypothetical protein